MKDGHSRLTLDLSASQTGFLNYFCEQYDATKAGTIRIAFNLLVEREEALRDGLSFGAWGKRHGEPHRTEVHFVIPSMSRRCGRE